MSYGPDIVETFRRSAACVDKILKGAKPAELPVQLPARLDDMVRAVISTPPSGRD